MKNYLFKLLFSCFISLIFISLVFSQEQPIRRCATFEIDSLAKLKNPQRAKNRKLFEQKIQNYLADNEQFMRNNRVASEIIKIPVVVHVIHNNADGIIGGSNNTNISDEQINSQITVLNEDYRKKITTLGYNSNPVGADTEIEFFLAKIDPNGNPTTGITRTYSTQKNFSVDTDRQLLASLAYWDSNYYINIWVCDLQGGLLGFTEFPGAKIDGLDPTDADASIDGTIISYKAFGRKIGTSMNGLYTFGRTLTHEIGHFFGLIHTWGDDYCGTDYCNDTPTAARANLSRYCTDVYSTCNGTTTKNMIENYMDYSPDSCMNIFTNDQKARMRAVMELSVRRNNLITYAKSLELPLSDNLKVTPLLNPSYNIIQLQILFKGTQDFSVNLYDMMGRNVYSQTNKTSQSTLLQIKSTTIPTGNYILSVNTSSESQTKRIAFVRN